MLPLLALQYERTDGRDGKEAPTHAPMSGYALDTFKPFAILQPAYRENERSWLSSWRTIIRQRYKQEAGGFVVTVDVDRKVAATITAMRNGSVHEFAEYVKHMVRFCAELTALIDLRQIVAELEVRNSAAIRLQEHVRFNAPNFYTLVQNYIEVAYQIIEIAAVPIDSLGNTSALVLDAFYHGPNNVAFGTVFAVLSLGAYDDDDLIRILTLPLKDRNGQTWLLHRYLDPTTPRTHHLYVNGSDSLIETMIPEKDIDYAPPVDLNSNR